MYLYINLLTKTEILIDAINIKDYNLYELRKKIGLVSQEPVLFKRSVYENIKYGRLDATREEVFNSVARLKNSLTRRKWERKRTLFQEVKSNVLP